jgi:hypothetical protein
LRLLVIVGRADASAGARAGQLADAVEVIALGAVLPIAAFRAVEVAGVDAAGFLATVECRFLAVTAALAGRWRLADGNALDGALTSCSVFVGLEERILVEHLVDLLLQLQCRQLQQPDRLLQLRRQCKML